MQASRSLGSVFARVPIEDKTEEHDEGRATEKGDGHERRIVRVWADPGQQRCHRDEDNEEDARQDGELVRYFTPCRRPRSLMHNEIPNRQSRLRRITQSQFYLTLSETHVQDMNADVSHIPTFVRIARMSSARPVTLETRPNLLFDVQTFIDRWDILTLYRSDIRKTPRLDRRQTFRWLLAPFWRIPFPKSRGANRANSSLLWHIGNGKNEMRRWFEKAVEWTKATNSNDSELRSSGREAAELLGVAGPDLPGPVATPAAPAPLARPRHQACWPTMQKPAVGATKRCETRFPHRPCSARVRWIVATSLDRERSIW